MPQEDYQPPAPALNYISNNLTDSLKIPQLASKYSMSEASFRRFFKKTIGVPPMDFIYSSRIKIASQLLHNKNLSISQKTIFSHDFITTSRHHTKHTTYFTIASISWCRRSFFHCTNCGSAYIYHYDILY